MTLPGRSIAAAFSRFCRQATGILAIVLLMVSTRVEAQSFVDATAGSGLSEVVRYSMGSPIWGDLNNDGRIDLFMSRHQTGYSLYHNRANGTFVDLQVLNYDIPRNYDLHVGGYGDFNNDGLLDLFIAYSGAGGPPPDGRVGIKNDQLYLNQGRNAPLEISESAGITNAFGRVQSISLLDQDNDGLLDIFVINRATPNLFWRNNGDGTFNDMALQLGLDDTPTAMHSMGVLGEFACWIDYDRDGDLDVFFTRSGDRLLRNDGGFQFTDVTAAANLVSSVQHQGVAWGDYNNDARIDLFVTGSRGAFSSNELYRNNGDGTFANVTNAAGVNSRLLSNPYGAAWGDYDNDGDLDLYIVNSGTIGVANGLDILYRNNSDGTFTDVTNTAGVTTVPVGHGEGVAWGDYTNDGFLDLVINNGRLGSETDFPQGPDLLYRNLGNQNHWVKIVPEGTLSNRAAIGVKVGLKAGGKVQFRELTDGGIGKLRSQGHGPLHFGLGQQTVIETLVVGWPSGLVERYYNLPVDRTHFLVEGEGGI